MRKTLRGVLAMTTALSMLTPTIALAAETADAPETTAPRLALPASVAVLGDSISAGTGADGGGQGGLPGQERPQNSWATGASSGLESVYQRIDALTPGTTVAFNLSENGRRSEHVLGQVQGSPADIDHILVQIGGNDLCRPTVGEMTPTAQYRENIDAMLAWVAENRPEATVQLNAVPDIYRLWEIRRTNFVAILFWGLGIIPCQSLLASPTSTSSANMARRAQVRERGLEYNDELREACEAYLRCRYDDDATWLFSNDPSSFVNSDISNQDHFHPSFAGQRKLAAVSWEAGFDFTDQVAPEVTVTVDPEPTAAGWHAGAVSVLVEATDVGEIAGLEVRVHDADGASAWSPVFAASTSLAVTDPGTTHVEARAIDRNGNVSGSVVQTIAIDDTAPNVSLDGPADGTEVLLGDEVVFGFSCDDDRSGVAACESSQDTDGLLDTSTVGLQTVTVTATDNAGNTSHDTLTYRVVYATGAASGRIDGPISIQRNATLPVRLAVADVTGTVVAGLEPALYLVDADGDRTAAGTLRYDPVEDRYTAQVSLRDLGVQPGVYDLVVATDDGVERIAAALIVR